MKRYNLQLPIELYNEVEKIAIRRQTTVVAVMRQFIKIGLLADKLELDPDTDLMIREGETTRIVRF